MNLSQDGNSGGDSNGKVRLSNRERIHQLHRKLHNEKTNENIIDKEPTPIVSSKPPRIRRNEVRKYLGDPLPLPYLTNSRQQSNNNNNEIDETTKTRKQFQIKKPLGEYKRQTFDDTYKEKLRDSLRNFQTRSSSRNRRSIDNETTIDQEEPTILSTESIKQRNNNTLSLEDKSPRGLILDNVIDKDRVITEFKQNNLLFFDSLKELSTPSISHLQDNKKLKEPLVPKKLNFKRDQESQYINVSLISILGSPILLFALTILLHYLIQKYLQF